MEVRKHTYGPNTKLEIAGIILFLIGLFIFVLFLIFLFIIITAPEFSFDLLSDFLSGSLINLIISAIFMGVGTWWIGSGAESIFINDQYIEIRKFWSRKQILWRDISDNFQMKLYSTQPKIRGRKGKEAWYVELNLTNRRTKKQIKFAIPDLSTEKDVVQFIRLLRTCRAIPRTKKKEGYSLISGKNQIIEFQIQHHKVSDLKKSKKKSTKKNRHK